jgi:hypothetical protein
MAYGLIEILIPALSWRDHDSARAVNVPAEILGSTPTMRVLRVTAIPTRSL